MLPKRLLKSPIIDAVFDIRINTENSLAISIPGLILQKYPKAKVLRLPAYGVPDQMLSDDPNLCYVPALRIEVGDGAVFLCGEKMFAVGYSQPYPGWGVFSEKIKEALHFLSISEQVKIVERVAIKYVDFVEQKVCDDIKQLSSFRVSLNHQDMMDKDFVFKVASRKEKVSYLLQFASNAKTANKIGFIIDTDTVLNSNAYYEKKITVNDLITDFSGIEYLHTQAKEVFFSTISQEGLSILGAEYDK